MQSFNRDLMALLAANSFFWLCGGTALAFPEFHAFAEKSSGRSVNCAMCHTSPSGPSGNEEGQLGSLSEDEMARVNKARSQLEPGQEVDSPILNSFGNQMIKTLGMKTIIQLKSDPAKLVEALGTECDLDGDGIPDSREFAEGTDPLNRFHGDPWRLFVNNLWRYRFDVALAALSLATIVFGLSNLVKGLHIMADQRARRGNLTGNGSE